MNITSLNLQYFKNYDSLKISFSDRLNCLLGKNGAGKTNVLDAIHYLAFTKSAFNSVDSQNVNHNSQYFRIEGSFESDKEHKILCYLEKGQKKEFRLDNISYERISDHIGKVQVVLHTPYDTELIRETSESRRKWIDGCISQYDHHYLEALLKYQKILRQRNSLLKSIEGSLNNANRTLLDTYDDQLIPLSLELAKKRSELVKELNPFFKSYLSSIVPESEECTITYHTKILDRDFREEFKKARRKDLVLQRTTMGAHRDDYVFSINERSIKKFGSQGQQKSFLIALRLGQYDHLKSKSGVTPILMLDDVFDKLDDQRIENLISLLNDPKRFSQIFITDARLERASGIFAGVEDKKMFEVRGGEISEL
jgi:DNA replication and repair protein RecF